MSVVGHTIARWAHSVTTARRRTPGYHTFGELRQAVEEEGGITSPLEAEAMAVERIFGKVTEAKAKPLDVDELAERVYELLRRDLRLERERAGSSI